MKHSRIIAALALVSFFYIAALHQRATHAAGGSAGAVCTLSKTGCLKSLVLAEAIPSVIVASASAPVSLEAPVDLFITCPVANSCGAQCAVRNYPTSASIVVALQEFSSQLHSLPPIASGAISTADSTMAPLNFAPAGSGFNEYTIAVTIPAGTPPGLYSVVGTATVTFSDGMTLTTGDQQVFCLAEEAPGQQRKPRLDIRLLSEPIPRCAPGEQCIARYKITNNDPEKSVRLTAVANSKQIALRPDGGNESLGVFSIANPFGDDFPIAFATADCLPLPNRPYIQSQLSEEVKKIRPGRSRIVEVSIRPYGSSARGSCSESSLRLLGTFSDGTATIVCAGMAAYADTSVKTQNCGGSVNDCNGNGVADADDIANGTSQDQNFNGIPDECEQGAPLITQPVEIIPSVLEPGRPIHVKLSAQDDQAVMTVWANGVTLRSQDGKLWEGDIPSSSDVGLQTVFAMAEDADHKFATHIGVYETRHEESDFRIEASNTPRTISPGEAADFVIAAKLLRGAGQPVTLSVEGLPDGTTGSFSANPLTPAPDEGSQTILTIYTLPSLPPGIYVLSVVGTSPGLRRLASVTLNVEVVDAFDFALRASASSVIIGVYVGGAEVDITVTAVGGTPGPVNLYAAGFPEGVSASFSQNPVIVTEGGEGKTTLTITPTSETVPLGDYQLIVVGTSGTLIRTVSLKLTITGDP